MWRGGLNADCADHHDDHHHHVNDYADDTGGDDADGGIDAG
jgi:hypothetical protein